MDNQRKNRPNYTCNSHEHLTLPMHTITLNCVHFNNLDGTPDLFSPYTQNEFRISACLNSNFEFSAPIMQNLFDAEEEEE